MFAGRSLKLATLFGIRIGVSSSWFVILFLLLYLFTERFRDTLGLATTGAFAVAAAAALLFFGSILLHELGHALAARREGIEVAGIDLFIFGGVMKMSREGPSAGAMFRIAAAGPLVTLVIVLGAGAAGAALSGLPAITDAARLDAAVGTSAVEQLVALLIGLNVILLLFNLVPALPLDGGQILRSAVWAATKDRGKGTRVAAVLGQGFAYLLMAYGAWLFVRGDAFGGVWAVALGFLIGQGARAAAAQNAFAERLEGITVADIMDSDPVTIPAALDAARAYDEYFLRYQGWEWFAVVEEDGRFVGLAHRAAVQHAALEERPPPTVREVAGASRTDAQVRIDAPLEALLASEPLRRTGALMALDDEGRLRGVVTFEQVTRALRAQLAPTGVGRAG
ncbi:MAG: site-2 protease family protein [Actinomycetota bacterium]|nr:site-2 protease family protein [Actinomycetota bacterium]